MINLRSRDTSKAVATMQQICLFLPSFLSTRGDYRQSPHLKSLFTSTYWITTITMGANLSKAMGTTYDRFSKYILTMNVVMCRQDFWEQRDATANVGFGCGWKDK